jgi:hypothetical protein
MGNANVELVTISSSASIVKLILDADQRNAFLTRLVLASDVEKKVKAAVPHFVTGFHTVSYFLICLPSHVRISPPRPLCIATETCLQS